MLRPDGRQRRRRGAPAGTRTGGDPEIARTSGRTGPRPRRPARPTTRSAGGVGLRRARHLGDEGGEAGILALREGGLDAAAGVAQHPHVGAEGCCERRCAARDRSSLITSEGQEPTRNSSRMSGRRSMRRRDHPVELLVRVGEAGEVALVDDRGGEARLGEDHHAGGRLDEVGAGARADHEEERVLDLAVQPDDAGEPAEHRALAALLADVAARLADASGGDESGSGAWAFIARPPRREPARQRLEPGGAELQHELRRVDRVGGVGGERQAHQAGGVEAARRPAPRGRRCAGPAPAC